MLPRRWRQSWKRTCCGYGLRPVVQNHIFLHRNFPGARKVNIRLHRMPGSFKTIYFVQGKNYGNSQRSIPLGGVTRKSEHAVATECTIRANPLCHSEPCKSPGKSALPFEVSNYTSKIIASTDNCEAMPLVPTKHYAS